MRWMDRLAASKSAFMAFSVLTVAIALLIAVVCFISGPTTVRVVGVVVAIVLVLGLVYVKRSTRRMRS